MYTQMGHFLREFLSSVQKEIQLNNSQRSRDRRWKNYSYIKPSLESKWRWWLWLRWGRRRLIRGFLLCVQLRQWLRASNDLWWVWSESVSYLMCWIWKSNTWQLLVLLMVHWIAWRVRIWLWRYSKLVFLCVWENSISCVWVQLEQSIK